MFFFLFFFLTFYYKYTICKGIYIYEHMSVQYSSLNNTMARGEPVTLRSVLYSYHIIKIGITIDDEQLMNFYC